jgi:hypothetical protein
MVKAIVSNATFGYSLLMANQLEWKRMTEVYDGKNVPTCSTYRAKVPGGWLIAIWAGPTTDKKNENTNMQTFGGGVTFVPDPPGGGGWALDDHPVK